MATAGGEEKEKQLLNGHITTSEGGRAIGIGNYLRVRGKRYFLLTDTQWQFIVR